jgi:probable HAF family extracellular repeat protein
MARRLRAALFAATTALTALTSVDAMTPARAQSFQGLGFLPGGTFSVANAVNADGSVVVGDGDSSSSSSSEAFRWTSSGMVGLGYAPGGTNSLANAVNADGSVVVGDGVIGSGNDQAFRWTSAGMVSLGFLPGGNSSSGRGVNADGTVVVGYSDNASSQDEAFRWIYTGSGPTGGTMTGLGFLPGGTYSAALGTNADGSVVVGYSSSTNSAPNYEAFRWFGGTMTGLGFLPGGTFSLANAVNADGSVVVGYSDSTNAGGNIEAFRWFGGTMTGLGFLPGGTYSLANAVNADGSVVVGYSQSTFAGGNQEAFRWTTSTGMQSVQVLLITSGVNMTGWTLTSANGVSADGSVIVGYGTDPLGTTEAWLARFSAQFGNGLITPGVVAQSFSGQSAMGQSGNAAIGGALGTFTEIATQAGNTQGMHTMPYSVYGYAGYDSDPAASGTFGMTVDLPDRMVAGAAVTANAIKTNMVYDGSAKMGGGSLGAFLARVPGAGLQWLLGVNGITLKGDINRGYLNGNSLVTSSGSTNANGFGATARIGWVFDSVWLATQVTPFTSYTYSTMHFNGYTETTGVFPAQFNGFNDTAQIVRLGADARYTFAPGKWVWGTLASAHKVNNSDSEDITGTLIGLFGMTAPAGPVAKNWVEATAGVRWPAWKNGALTASLTASIPANYPTTYQARVGVTQTF